MRSPHTIGLAWDSPGIFTFHAMLGPDAAQVSGSFMPSTTPAAAVPRNCGYPTGAFWAETSAVAATHNVATERRCSVDIRRV